MIFSCCVMSDHEQMGVIPIFHRYNHSSFISIGKVWDRADEFVPERFDLEGPIPNESNTDFRLLYNIEIHYFILLFMGSI